MLACGCVWLWSRCAPLTAAAASLLERGRHRRNAGGYRGRSSLPLWPLLTMPRPSKACEDLGNDRCQNIAGIHERRGL
jgi:hypothetical protein